MHVIRFLSLEVDYTCNYYIWNPDFFKLVGIARTARLRIMNNRSNL